ncbi:hypothetical protein SynMEDNS5_00811 [Synechococcus sp. MEDNS5]|nr:hypothetical protein SynMEDNS5_00811 [Synechococcus sp. MEDNS5]
MVVTALDQPLCVFNHPLENSVGHAFGRRVGRELKPKFPT